LKVVIAGSVVEGYTQYSFVTITFDDEWSVKQKCKFVRKNHMAGVMFWEYSDDKKEYLLDEINKEL